MSNFVEVDNNEKYHQLIHEKSMNLDWITAFEESFFQREPVINQATRFRIFPFKIAFINGDVMKWSDCIQRGLKTEKRIKNIHQSYKLKIWMN